MRKIRYDRIAGVFATLFILWVFASFIDVNIHNSLGANYGNFAKWNFFINLFNLMEV